MKKTLVAIAALTAVAAFAQSTATIGGVVRFGYQKAPNATTTAGVVQKGDTGFTMTDATVTVGLSEDLGGGLRAAANMTFDGASGTFAQPLNRRNSSLSLTGGFGQIRFDQTRSSDLLNRALVAPSNLPEGLYSTSGIIGRAGIDSFTYGIQMGAISASLSLVENANDGSVSPGRMTTVVGLGYANGPLTAGVSFKNTAGKNGFAAPAVKGNTELFATYNLGVATVGFGYDSKQNAGAGVTAANATKSAIGMGVAVPLGAATVGLNYAKRGTAKVTEVAANYALSKRTSINASFGTQSASASAPALAIAGAAAPVGAVTNAKQNQYRLSVAHAF